MYSVSLSPYITIPSVIIFIKKVAARPLFTNNTTFKKLVKYVLSVGEVNLALILSAIDENHLLTF
tara:strand:+ start:763 stop:957 length:195 start_codon:yes stop_codon:yes gene_type:complete